MEVQCKLQLASGANSSALALLSQLNCKPLHVSMTGVLQPPAVAPTSEAFFRSWQCLPARAQISGGLGDESYVLCQCMCTGMGRDVVAVCICVLALSCLDMTSAYDHGKSHQEGVKRWFTSVDTYDMSVDALASQLVQQVLKLAKACRQQGSQE